MTDDRVAGGQRWISEVEPELGLGTVFSLDSRRITLLFQASGEVRHYPRQDPPLRRVQFRPGQRIHSHQGWSLQVERVEERDGLLVYRGEGRSLAETELSESTGLRSPADRLLRGPRDDGEWFRLRVESLHHWSWWEGSSLRGMVGPRLSLEPQRLALVEAVSGRLRPRLIIADPAADQLIPETGWILHRWLCEGHGVRALLLAPRDRLDAWARELSRCFQLTLPILDERHCQVLEAAGEDNPFAVGPLILADLQWLAGQSRRQLQALTMDWQCLVVDRIQQLDRGPARPGSDYLLVTELSERIPRLLLLAPGDEGTVDEADFLQLLEPASFADPAHRPAEQAKDRELVALARTLAGGQSPGDSVLLDALPDALRERPSTEDGPGLLDALSLRHSTARLLFRGVRRVPVSLADSLRPAPLPCPRAYQEVATQPYPERVYRGRSPWWRIDPRVNWLLQRVGALDQVVVLTGHGDTAQGLHGALERTGVEAVCLHERHTPRARDRALGRFLAGDGPTVLICSDGVVGRHCLPMVSHWVFFDLPLDPMVWPTRVAGWGDPDGQAPPTVELPYLLDTAQAVLFQWYQEALEGFSALVAPWLTDPRLATPLAAALSGDSMEPLLDISRRLRDDFRDQQALASDRLGELNLWRNHGAGTALVEALQSLDDDRRLADYLARLWRLHGFETTADLPGVLRLAPGEGQPVTVPGVPETGTLISFSRDRALTFEAPVFLSWDHPMVAESLHQLLGGERGNACVVAWRDAGQAPELLLEAVYVLAYPAAAELGLAGWFPPTPVRTVVDAEFVQVAEHYSHQRINQDTVALDERLASALIHHHREVLEAMLEVADINVRMSVEDRVAARQAEIHTALEARCQSLEAQQPYESVPLLGELNAARWQLQGLTEVVESASLTLDALRLVVGQD